MHTLIMEVGALPCFQLIKLFLNSATVRNLSIVSYNDDNLLPDDEDSFLPRLTDCFDFRSLQSLALRCDRLSFLSAVLDWIRVSEELYSLEILTNPIIPHDGRHERSRHSKRWESFISDASPGRRYPSVNTFITNWTHRPADFIQAVTNLTPHVRALVLKINPDEDKLEQIGWSLEELESPAHSSSESSGSGNRTNAERVPLPRLNIATVKIGDTESSRNPSFNTLEEELLPKFKATLPDLLNSRVRSGADPIRKVFLQSFSQFDCPEVREFPQADGFIIQLEACHS